MNSSTASLPQINIVAVCYQLDPDEFVAKLCGLALRCGWQLRGIVVANHPNHSSSTSHADIQVMSGTNVYLDFSGYFEGLNRLFENRPAAASGNVLFVNDSLFTGHGSFVILRHVLKLAPLLEQIRLPAIAGKFDSYRSICLRNPWSGHSGYVTSFCFLLNRYALPVMGNLLADAAADGVLSDAPIEQASWGTKLSPVMREYIRAHLSYRASPYLWRSFAASDGVVLRKKSQCAYFEHRLSGAIGTDGAVVPINAGPRSRAAIYWGETLARIARLLKGLA